VRFVDLQRKDLLIFTASGVRWHELILENQFLERITLFEVSSNETKVRSCPYNNRREHIFIPNHWTLTILRNGQPIYVETKVNEENLR